MKYLSTFIVILILVFACKEDDEVVQNTTPAGAPCTNTPNLVTENIERINQRSILFKGVITRPTCDTLIVSQGFVYDTNPFPELDDIVIKVSGDSIEHRLDSLLPNTVYYYRTYYRNATGIYYGNEISFMTSNPVYLDSNGVTVKAFAWASIGDKGVIDSVEYTIVDNSSLNTSVLNGDDLSKLCVSRVNNLSNAFSGISPSQINDITSWDVSNVTEMSNLFQSNNSFNQDISKWDVSNVTKMNSMFDGAINFNQDISSWNVQNANSMKAMFRNSNSFNQNISTWNVSNVTDMNAMFFNAVSFNQDLSVWNVSNCTDCENFSSNTLAWNLPKPNFTNCSDIDQLTQFIVGDQQSNYEKTWMIDSMAVGHFGVGPAPGHPDFDGYYPKWYSSVPNDKSGVGLYDDRYKFKLANNGFEMITKGNSYVHTDFISSFTGAFQNKGDYTVPKMNVTNSTWQLNQASGTDTTITLTNSAWLGMYTGVNVFRILSISNNHMYLMARHSGNADLAWYLRLIPEGSVSGGGTGGGGGTSGFNLPFDFESNPPTFTGFGGSTVLVEDNPDKRGINTSNKVLKTIKGHETWAGIEVDLANKLDFSTNDKLKLKVWSSRTSDTLRVGIKDQNNRNNSIYVDVPIPIAFGWVELSVGFSSASSNVYDIIELFPGWNVPNAGTYYIDDIKQGQ